MSHFSGSMERGDEETWRHGNEEKTQHRQSRLVTYRPLPEGVSSWRGDGGLGTGSGVELARSSSELTVKGDPFLTSVHSTKAAKSSRGPCSDDGALHEVFKLAS